jgi:cell division protein FtsL
MKQLKLYIGITMLSIIVLTVARVVVTNTISTDGIDLAKIQARIAEYKKENTLLHEQILSLTSLNHIASEAGELGFVTSKKEMVLTAPPPLALNQ